MEILDSVINFDGNFDRIPEGWDVIPLSEFLKVQGGYAFKSDHMVDYGVPLIRISNIKQSGIDYKDVVYLPQEYIAEHSNFLANNGDILIAMSGATTGKVAKVVKEDLPALINQRVGRFKFRNNQLDCNYFYHILKTSDFIKEVTIDAVGGAQPNISGYEIESLKLLTPPLPEQRRIAEILDTVDETIRKTEQIINKLKSIKAGLLHDLLTRGIDENGNLRDPEKNPEEFRETELGVLPKSWGVNKLNATASNDKNSFVDGDWIEAPHITNEGIRLIQTGNIGVEEFFDKPNDKKFISNNTFNELKCKWVYPGDILICRLADPIGRACIVPQQVGESITSVDCTIYRPNLNIVDRSYILHYLNSDFTLRRLDRLVGGSTRQRISRRNLGEALISIPPLKEQKLMSEILDNVSAGIEKNERYAKKLYEIKKGLMNDLLTGKVRVNADKELVV